MIPREELLFTLAMAEKGLRSETPPEVMAELCRVYLAWADAATDGAPVVSVLRRKSDEFGRRAVSERKSTDISRDYHAGQADAWSEAGFELGREADKLEGFEE